MAVSVEEVQALVATLSPDELERAASLLQTLRDNWDQWDQQMAEDVEAGRLDALLQEAEADYQAGRVTEL